MLTRRLLATAALLLLTACGGGSSTATPTPTPAPTGPVAATGADLAGIRAAYEGFFNPAGTVAEHAALLENGDRFTAVLTASAKDPAAADLSAKVLSATVDGTSAEVVYDLMGKGGAKLLPGAQGKATKVGGTWKVAQFTFCQLTKLQSPTGKVAGCP